MIKLESVILLCAILGFSKADYCEDNFTMGELPQGILVEAVEIVLTGTLGSFQGCPGNVEVPDEDVKFWFFNRANPEVPILLDPQNPSQIDPTKPTKVLIPGWLCNVTNDRMPQLRRAYLQQEDCNVIGIDWTARSIDLYSNSFCSIPGVAEIISRLLCSLPINLETQVHVVGHSMGGQISGIVGSQVKGLCQKNIARITGLDPAGPLYQTEPPNNRLDKTDAQFVDVIHTNQAFLGYFGNCGDIDFYPNCGAFQPGCDRFDNIANINDLLNAPIKDVGCNHLRSIDYMIESINPGTKTFKAKTCSTCPGALVVGTCQKQILFPQSNVMGEDCNPGTTSPSFVLSTNDASPFARG